MQIYHYCAVDRTTEPVFPFLVFSYHQNGGGIEDGGIGPTENTNEQDDHEMTDAFSAE